MYNVDYRVLCLVYGTCFILIRAHTVTTRGTNSKAKEELMNIMDKQLAKCGDSVVNVIRNFFKNERLCFIVNE